MKRKLQVFVSSTFIDLKSERQAAVSAILKSGHIPAGMELFTAGNKSQLDVIKRWIDESDVYMLILGGRYGSVDPESGVSYTELEYNYALDSGKPLFAVVINEDYLKKKIQAVGLDIMEREKPAELKLFRTKVLSNISSFFDDEKDIKLCVMESLSDIAADNTLAGWIPANQLPDTKLLDNEMERLRTELASLQLENEELLKKVTLVGRKPDPEKTFEELNKVLSAIKITLPKEISGEEEKKKSLAQLFENVQTFIIAGVTDQPGKGSGVKFIYSNVCPKLQVHGLVKNDKIPGIPYHRYTITKLGQEYLAYLDRKKHLRS